MAKQYYRGAHGVIMMYSVTEMTSFENVENWFNELENYIDKDTKILLIGNKVQSIVFPYFVDGLG
jgi:GTPase SAR1 family protein